MTEDDFETTMDKSGTISSNPKSDTDSSKPVATTDSSTSSANVTTVATTSVVTGPIDSASNSQPVTNTPATAVATKTSKPATTNQNTTAPNKGGAGSISESKPKSGAELSAPTAASLSSTANARPPKTIEKKESASNDALVSTNIERSTTTLTETSTSTQWTRTQTPSGATKYNEITEVRVQSAVDTKTITKEKSTLAISKSDNITAESSTNEEPASKSSHGSAVITTGVGLTLVPVDDSSSGTPQRKNSEIANKENEVQNDQIVKLDGSMSVSITKKESETETGSENDHPENALEVILMTDDGNKKSEKSAELEKSDSKPEKTSKKKKKKQLTDVKSPKMSKKDSKLVKKYNREFLKSFIKFSKFRKPEIGRKNFVKQLEDFWSFDLLKTC